jgi:hypothetical protein
MGVEARLDLRPSVCKTAAKASSCLTIPDDERETARHECRIAVPNADSLADVMD